MKLRIASLLLLGACASTAPAAAPVSPAATVAAPPAPAPAPAPEVEPTLPAELDFGQSIADGSEIKIVEIAETDAYYQDRGNIVGKLCRVSGDLHQTGAYYAGGAICPDGTEYYFYQVRVIVTAAAAAPIRATPTTAATGAIVPAGTRFTISDVSPEDAYFDDRATIVNQACVANQDLDEGSPGFYSGDVTCDNGTTYYFYKIAIAGLAAAPAAAVVSYGATINKGARFTVIDVHPDDAYISDRATIVNQACVASDALTEQGAGSGYYAGQVACGNGTNYYFYKVAVTSLTR